MKSIKKIFLVAIATLLSISFASAQFGVQAGFSMTKTAEKDADGINGFHVGPTFNLTIQGPISLQYGLLYNLYIESEKTDKEYNSWLVTKSTLHQIDIPVRVAATFPLSGGISAFAFAGPNFNFGLAGNSSLTTYIDGKKSDKFSFVGDDIYKTDKDLSRFNLQLGLGAGFQYDNMGVRFSYDFGLLDMHKSDAINYRDNGLKVGLFFNF